MTSSHNSYETLYLTELAETLRKKLCELCASVRDFHTNSTN